MVSYFKKPFSVFKPPSTVVLLTPKLVYFWTNKQDSPTFLTTTVSELYSHQGNNYDIIVDILDNKRTVWVLANAGYQILPKKHCLGNSLQVHHHTLDFIAHCHGGKPSHTQLFAFEELWDRWMPKHIYKLALSTNIVRTIVPQQIAKIFPGMPVSKLSTNASPLASTTLEIKEISQQEIIEQLHKKITKTPACIWQKALFIRAISQLYKAEVIIMCLLILLSSASFWAVNQPSTLRPPRLSQPITTRPINPPAHLWQFSDLNTYLQDLSAIIDDLDAPIITSVIFQTPTLNLSGYWQAGASKVGRQKEWRTLLSKLNHHPNIRQVEIMQDPMQGNLSEKRYFRLQLHLQH